MLKKIIKATNISEREKAPKFEYSSQFRLAKADYFEGLAKTAKCKYGSGSTDIRNCLHKGALHLGI